jgi:anaerobic magnesium-protoporphyrin IX monomethyl ester cyclase
MPMDLLLTHGYFLAEDPKELAVMKPYAPLGILYLSSYLEKKGFGVEVYDATFGSREELFRILQDGPPSVLGIYGNLMTRRNVLDIMAVARSAGWTLVLGGPEPAAYPREYLAAGADAIVDGEGEITLEELLAAIRTGGALPLERVGGLILAAGDGAPVRTAVRPLIPDLDDEPWPDREKIDIDRYLGTWRDHHGAGSLSVIASRGCPYSCRWCSHATYGRTHRRRSPRGVADEVEWLIHRYQPEMLWMADDVFTIHHGWILDYALEMKRRGIRIPFECITRADRFNVEMADALAGLGCFRIWIGSESGSQRILDSMERGVRLEQVSEAVRLCRDRGIQSGMFVMWGYEGEEAEDVEATVEHVKSSLPDILLTTIAYPIKGTPYYDEVASRLTYASDWADSSDRDVTIRGRQSQDFYRYADRLLKSEMALQKVKDSLLPGSETTKDLLHEIGQARRALLSSAGQVLT